MSVDILTNHIPLPGLFKYVLLVGTVNDLFVPSHSALIEHCKQTVNSNEAEGYYTALINNVNETVVASKRLTALVKYTVMHASSKTSRFQQITGRAG